MIDSRPIFIAGSPRSGTTMLAGLLKLHGVWVGESRVTIDPASNSLIGTENIPIKKAMGKLLHDIGYTNRKIPFPSETDMDQLDHDTVWKVLFDVVPHNKKWLYKSAGLLIFYKQFIEKFPEARWVLPRRNPQDIVDSIKRHAYMKFNADTKDFVEYVLKHQFSVEEAVNHSMSINSKEVANLNMEVIEQYFNFCEVEMDEKIVCEFVNPKMMH